MLYDDAELTWSVDDNVSSFGNYSCLSRLQISSEGNGNETVYYSKEVKEHLLFS